jgi:hypothetical protein
MIEDIFVESIKIERNFLTLPVCRNKVVRVLYYYNNF